MAGTRKVRMITGQSGYRHDGRPWPPMGAEIDVPAWEADDLIRGGNAVAASDDRETRDGERVAAWTPAGTEVTTRPGGAEEVMTGHPAGHDKVEHPDYRPPSQILAEDYDEEERERIGTGEVTMADADAQPARSRAERRATARKETARARAGARESALAYAEHGVSGAPGSEVPAYEGGVPAPDEGVRPASQVEAEDMGRAADESDWAVAERESRAGRADGAGEAGTSHGVDHVMAPVAATPSPGDPKQAWIDYAVASGADVHEAGAMTKADLMSRYGGRL